MKIVLIKAYYKNQRNSLILIKQMTVICSLFFFSGLHLPTTGKDNFFKNNACLIYLKNNYSRPISLSVVQFIRVATGRCSRKRCKANTGRYFLYIFRS